MRLRSFRLAVVQFLILVSLGGCCSVPRAETYFDRGSPINALQAFAYAVDTAQYDFAYETLTPASQEAFTRSQFKMALRFGVTVPQVGESLRDVILRSERKRFRERFEDASHVSYQIKYEAKDDVLWKGLVYLEREPEADAKAAGRVTRWLIDFKSTLAEWSKSTP